MMGLGDTTRGNNSRGHMAPLAEAQGEQPSSREVSPVKEGSWQSEEDLVGYFRNRSWERKDNMTPLV